MNSASREWVARVSARNEIETAKALRGLRAVPLSAGGAPRTSRPTVCQAASAGQEVAK